MPYPLETLPHKTVVVVEDDALVRELAVVELEDSGFTVVGFATADEALPYLRRNGSGTAVLLTDVQMPGALNGLQLAEIVSRLCPGVPILVTSGGSLVDPGRLPPSAKFLRKPWRPDDLVARIRGLAAVASGTAATAATATAATATAAAVSAKAWPHAASAVSTSFTQ